MIAKRGNNEENGTNGDKSCVPLLFADNLEEIFSPCFIWTYLLYIASGDPFMLLNSVHYWLHLSHALCRQFSSRSAWYLHSLNWELHCLLIRQCNPILQNMWHCSSQITLPICADCSGDTLFTYYPVCKELTNCIWIHTACFSLLGNTVMCAIHGAFLYIYTWSNSWSSHMSRKCRKCSSRLACVSRQSNLM